MPNRSLFFENRSLFFESRSMFLSQIGVCFLTSGVCFYRKSEFVFWKSEFVFWKIGVCFFENRGLIFGNRSLSFLKIGVCFLKIRVLAPDSELPFCSWVRTKSVADPGKGPGNLPPPPPHLYFWTKLRPEGRKKNFLETTPLLISGSGLPPLPLIWRSLFQFSLTYGNKRPGRFI